MTLYKSGQALPVPAGELVLPRASAGSKGSGAGLLEMGDDCQVCSCNNVSKGQICGAIREKGLGHQNIEIGRNRLVFCFYAFSLAQ